MEKIPRRLKRFHREKEKPLLEKLKGLSKQKQKKFNEKMKIEKENPDKVAEDLFEQIKIKKDTKISGKKSDKKKNILRSKDKKNPGKEKKPKEKDSYSKKEGIPLWKQRKMQRIKRQDKKEPEKKEEKTGKKTEEKKIRKHGRKKELKEELPDLETETKGMDIKDLFNGKKTEKTKRKNELNDLNLDLNLDGKTDETEIKELKEEGKTETEEIQELSLDASEAIEEIKEEEGKKCINCGQKFNVLIFCPKCGNAFCDKCAKIKQPEGTKTKYLCPHCGNTVKK